MELQSQEAGLLDSGSIAGTESSGQSSASTEQSNVFIDFFTGFSVHPVVTIRSKYLKVPQIICLSLAFAAVFGTSAARLWIFEPVAVQVVPFLEVRRPASNFWTCSAREADCNVSSWPRRPSYCDKPAAKCYPFHFAEILPAGDFLGSGVAIGLSQKEWCSPLEHSCIGRDNSTKWVQNVEDLTIKVRTSFHVVDKNAHKIRAHELQSVLQFKNGTTMRLWNRNDSEHEVYPVQHGEWFKRRYPERCGHSTGDVGTCMSTIWGEYITLKILFEAAGADLDASWDRGMTLDFGIIFSSMDANEFWSWPWGFKPKIVYVPQIRELGSDDSAVFFPEAGVDAEITKVARVVHIKAWGEGILGVVNPIYIMTELAIMGTIYTMVTAVVRNVLARLYARMPNLRHVSYLQDLASRQQTPPCTQFQGESMDQIYHELKHNEKLVPDSMAAESATRDFAAVAARIV